MLNNRSDEIRQTLASDQIVLSVIFFAKLAILTTIIIIVGLTCVSFLFYRELYAHDFSGPAGPVLWAITLHKPIILDAIAGRFSRDGVPIYLAVTSGVTISGLIAVVVTGETRRNSRVRALAADRISVALPRYSKLQRGVFAGKYGGKVLWSSVEDRALVVGPPGTGKTTFMLNQIIRSTKELKDFIAVDIKPEIATILWEELEKSGYKVIELDPINRSGSCYNPIEDIQDDSELSEFCESLIPLSSGDPVWVKAEQAYFRIALMYLKYKYPGNKDKCSLPTAYQLIGSHPSAEAFLKTVARSTHRNTRQAAEKLSSLLSTSKPALAGFGAVFDRLHWLSLDSVAETLGSSDFSLKALGRSERPVALFLKFEETHLATMGSLLSALYGHILSTLIKTSAKRRPITLYLDEIGNIPPIAGLLPKLNTIRARNLPTWMYWQSTQQMQAYGVGAREVFFGAADLQMFFRSNDIDTMGTVERLSGKKTIPRFSESITAETVTRSVSSERVPRIEAAELAELKPGEIITFYRGSRWRGKAVPHYEDFRKYKR